MQESADICRDFLEEQDLYVRPFGEPVLEVTSVKNMERCIFCNDPYILENFRCVKDTCNLDDFLERLQEDPPNVSGCIMRSLDDARMMYLDDLLDAGI